VAHAVGGGTIFFVEQQPGQNYFYERETMLRVFVFSFVVCSLTIATFGSLPNSQAQSSAANQKASHVRAGADTFTHNCQQCHSVYEGQYSFGPNLYHEAKPPHPKKTPTEIRVILKNGKGKMPAFNDKLSSGQMDDLIAYIRSL
jgi:mono/diheme cytochrome c family protein